MKILAIIYFTLDLNHKKARKNLIALEKELINDFNRKSKNEIKNPRPNHDEFGFDRSNYESLCREETSHQVSYRR